MRAHIALGALAPIVAPTPSPTTPDAADDERLLTVAEAATKLGVSKDWLYRHSSKLPFTVRPSAGTVRFSCRGIEQYIHRRTGARGGADR